MKTETDSNDITECQHYDKPSTGVLGFLIFILLSNSSVQLWLCGVKMSELGELVGADYQ